MSNAFEYLQVYGQYNWFFEYQKNTYIYICTYIKKYCIYKYIYISENIISIEHPSLYCKHLFYLYQYSIRPNRRLRTVGLERSGDSWVWVGCMMCHLRSSRAGTTWTNSGGECCMLKKRSSMLKSVLSTVCLRMTSCIHCKCTVCFVRQTQ